MEFEILDERVNWEVQRVAAAFGVNEWERQWAGPEQLERLHFAGNGCQNIPVLWSVDSSTKRWLGVLVYVRDRQFSSVHFEAAPDESSRPTGLIACIPRLLNF